MIWQPEFTDKTLSRKPGAVQNCPQNGSVPGKTYSSKALMSGNVKNAQIASVKVQYLDKQKKLAVMNIEYN
ncbi:fimbrial protein [Escherichia coli]|nr:fimbrial protein [Escherichia coli]